jgi:hypothetical protein
MRLIVTFCEGVAGADGLVAGGVVGGVEVVESDAVTGAAGASGAGDADASVPSGKRTGRKMGAGASKVGADAATETGEEAGAGSSAHTGRAARKQARKMCVLQGMEETGISSPSVR